MARKKPDTKLAREFGFAWPVFTAFLAALMVAPRWVGFLWWEPKPHAVVPLLAVGLGMLAISLIAPRFWLGFFRFWMRWITRPLSWLMTRLLLSLFFYLFMTPFVLALRLFGKRFLDTRWKDGRESYWRDHEPAEASVDRYRRQF